jgi:TonB family protein
VIYGRDFSIHLNLKRSSTPYDAAERVSFSSDAFEVESPRVAPKYPLLAKSMNVQGSVVLLARIDQIGNIEKLQVLSGPEILASAAQEAVKQWHFKPSFPSGQAVNTETRITVKFSILTQ